MLAGSVPNDIQRLAYETYDTADATIDELAVHAGLAAAICEAWVLSVAACSGPGLDAHDDPDVQAVALALSRRTPCRRRGPRHCGQHLVDIVDRQSGQMFDTVPL
jgi:hypothetical protein